MFSSAQPIRPTATFITCHIPISHSQSLHPHNPHRITLPFKTERHGFTVGVSVVVGNRPLFSSDELMLSSRNSSRVYLDTRDVIRHGQAMRRVPCYLQCMNGDAGDQTCATVSGMLRNRGQSGLYTLECSSSSPSRIPNGPPLPTGELQDYVRTHDWDFPTCFCPLLATGTPSKTTLIVPVTPTSEHVGSPCLTCPTKQCSYFLNLEDLVDRFPDLPCKVFPKKDPITPSSSQSTPSKAARTLIFRSPVQHAIKSAPPSPSKAPKSILRKINIISPPPSGSAFGDVFTANFPVKTEDIPPSLQALFDEDALNGGSSRDATESPARVTSDAAKQAFRDFDRREAQLKGRGYHRDNGLIDDLTRFWTDVPELSGRRACDVPVLGDIDTMSILFRLDGEKDAGVPYKDLIRILSHCDCCGLIMTPRKLQLHSCDLDTPFVETTPTLHRSLGSSSAGPSSSPSALYTPTPGLKRKRKLTISPEHIPKKVRVWGSDKGKGKEVVKSGVRVIEHADGVLEILSDSDDELDLYICLRASTKTASLDGRFHHYAPLFHPAAVLAM
ncbi:uncharacterized protein STEHIDRAFT_115631 [Stereum hirsutum FP-91666 SS1]|uniref:uncharacterized protein n=1 Tax=Stereum hirsutum (strain FP-91666) TaxID=721885 RepID=UPI0004449975|nr:uncharacterized protein STEHIDRAFT_115631 [Stereum hirsutum FP-91666 SS1]EIM80780.1 hypothetical protein STEHIDRAFT_115631 [Stereum hirsutum FP-91666 SS1]